MSASLQVIPRPSALQLACDAVLQTAPSPFASLVILASLRDADNRDYFHSGLAAQLAENLLQSTLEHLHGHVFLE
jgi:hypothetical protein